MYPPTTMVVNNEMECHDHRLFLLSEKKVVFWPIFFLYFHFHPKKIIRYHNILISLSKTFKKSVPKWCHSFPKVAIHHYVINDFSSSLTTFLLCGSVVYCNSNTLRSLTLKERLVLLKTRWNGRMLAKTDEQFWT